MIVYVLGAPGAGKSALTPYLRTRLPAHLVIDWDAFMGPAGELSGRDIRSDATTWGSYRDLVRSVVEIGGALDVVLLGVCTPQELSDWPNGLWVLLDCSDDERRRRLRDRDDSHDHESAVDDALSYRSLDLPILDTTNLDLASTADSLADFIRSVGPPPA